MTVALGVAGAGVAFALKEVIASFAGWFAITFAGFYSPGDRVQLEEFLKARVVTPQISLYFEVATPVPSPSP